MRGFRVSQHAAERFQERFPGQAGGARATKTLEKMARKARRQGQKASGERLYREGNVLMVVRERVIVTVYSYAA